MGFSKDAGNPPLGPASVFQCKRVAKDTLNCSAQVNKITQLLKVMVFKVVAHFMLWLFTHKEGWTQGNCGE